MSCGYYQPYWVENGDELEHFGIKGMKWGIRRYQNPDGTLTEAGKKRYGTAENLQATKQKRKETAIKVVKTSAKVAAGAAATALAVAGANAGIKLASDIAFKVAVNDINNGRAVSIGTKAILALDATLNKVKVSSINSLNKTLNIQHRTRTGFKRTAARDRVQKELEDAYYEYLREKNKHKIGSYRIAEVSI